MAGPVIVEIFAGLGNQLFQFAAGYGLARLTGSELEVLPIPGGKGRQFALDKFAIDLRYARQRTLKQRIENRVLHHTGIALPGLFRQAGFSFDERFLKLRPPVRLRGYFQSELHFAHVAGDIRRMIRLRQRLSPEAEQVAAEIDAAPLAVSIHIRRGDYGLSGPGLFHHVLDTDYYRRATRLLSALLGAEPQYFIFSDEPERAAEDLGFLPHRRIATVGLG
ncbi:MAG: alpha-1,2-fucosyltransferase, partial [Bauldia sp.]